MEIINKEERNEAHAYIPELKELYRAGRITRREFLRNATLLGMSALAASTFVAGCAPPDVEPEVPDPTDPPEEPEPVEPPVDAPHRGGKLRLASQVQRVTHPAQFSWVSPSNQLRQVAEYLTYTDGDNITHPWLLEDWKVSEDLLEWTLNLRQGIMHNNGDQFNADDVVFSLNEWLDPDVGSSILGLMGYLSPEGIEKVDDHTVKLHLDTAEIAVPEHLFHYPALVLNHRTFEGDFIRAPHGTGPYTLEDYSEGERVLLKRRDDYWQMGADGEPLPYLDEMEFIDMGSEMSAWIAAIQGGEVDCLDQGDIGGYDVFLGLRDEEGIVLDAIPTAQTRVLRARVDIDPWTDNDVRRALKLCQDHEKILALAHFGEGLVGQNFHVAPVHPEYCDMSIAEFNPEKARQLLADAGYPDGLDVELAVASGWSDVVAYGEILQEDAAAGGFNITINTMPVSQYWEQWTEVALGITPWTHRPLGTMVLNLAYVADPDGTPASWNESRWIDDEFTELLTQANGTLDVEERREIFCELQRIQYERGSIGIPFWRNRWNVYADNVHDVPPHPTFYMMYNEVWKEPV